LRISGCFKGLTREEKVTDSFGHIQIYSKIKLFSRSCYTAWHSYSEDSMIRKQIWQNITVQKLNYSKYVVNLSGGATNTFVTHNPILYSGEFECTAQPLHSIPEPK